MAIDRLVLLTEKFSGDHSEAHILATIFPACDSPLYVPRIGEKLLISGQLPYQKWQDSYYVVNDVVHVGRKLGGSVDETDRAAIAGVVLHVEPFSFNPEVIAHDLVFLMDLEPQSDHSDIHNLFSMLMCDSGRSLHVPGIDDKISIPNSKKGKDVFYHINDVVYGCKPSHSVDGALRMTVMTRVFLYGERLKKKML
jgi:hypothetical protein